MSKIEDKGVTQFTPTAEDLAPDQGPQKTADSYASRQKKREAVDSVKGKGGPLGGAPPIPEGKLQSLVPDTRPQPDFGEVPEEVVNDEFDIPVRPQVGGVGSGYEVNQAMARGETDGPISMAEARSRGMGTIKEPKPLSDESIEALNAAKAEMDSTKKRMEDAERGFVDDARDSSSKSASLPFDLEQLFQQQNQNVLINEGRRKAIESRLDPLSIEDMITKRGLQQTVIIVPDKLDVTLRTFTQKEHIWILQYIYEYPGSQAYNEQLLDTFKMVLSLVAINGARLPDHRKNVGSTSEEVDRELFEKKMGHVANLPVQLIADIGVQCNWFNDRVNQLFTYENVKNG